MERQVDQLSGSQRVVAMRELAEVRLSGMRDLPGAVEVLNRILTARPNDPIATPQLARIHALTENWDALQKLGNPDFEIPVDELAERQHMVADALWRAEEWERAAAEYEKVLARDPDDLLADQRRRAYLERAEKWEELVRVMRERVKKTDDDDERNELLAAAAGFAENKLSDHSQAIELWEQRDEATPGEMANIIALARLYAETGDNAGVARMLHAQLNETSGGQQRIDVLRKLGAHYAEKLESDERAEECWREILSIDSKDIPAREALMALHTRRGDFEALNLALMRQVQLTNDTERRL